VDAEGALRAASRAVELFPEAGAAWFALASAAEAAGDPERTEEALRKAVAVEPDIGMWHNNLGWFLLGRGDEHARDALRLFDRARKLEPGNPYVFRNRAIALQLAGRTREGKAARRAHAEEELERHSQLVRDHPEDVDSQYGVTAQLLELGRLEETREANRALAASARAAQRADRLYDAAHFALGLGDDDEARKLYEEAAGLDSTSSEAHYYRAFFGLARGDEAAVAEGVAGLHENRYPIASDADGYGALLARDPAEAKSQFEATLVRRPLRCCSHAWRGVACAMLGEPAETTKMLERAQVLCMHGGQHCASLRLARRELERVRGSASV
jgi:tetratricopeptide (TPR) repeat protein